MWNPAYNVPEGRMRIKFFLFMFLAALCAAEEIPFKLHTIDLGRNEACAVADVNGDGQLDIIAGENWFEAPSWKKHPFRKLFIFNNYLDDFSDLPLDVDSDGDIDIISVAWGSRPRPRTPRGRRLGSAPACSSQRR